jgi:hypothetical protein
LSATRAENIRGLNVAVNNAFRMSGIQRIRHLDRDLQQLIKPQRTAGNTVLQRLAIQKFHGDEMLALIFVNFVDRADVGMVQRRGRACLALEPFQRSAIAPHFLREEFERNFAAELFVLGLVNNAHAPAAKFLNDKVMRYGLADHGQAVAQS